jgi:hypothetical protein
LTYLLSESDEEAEGERRMKVKKKVRKAGKGKPDFPA